MRTRLRQSGISLMEMTVVLAVISLLVGLSLPGIRAFYNSFESRGGARSVISAAMASARAIAAKEQRYAGIRFQKIYDRDAVEPNDPLTAPQYMIFIIQDPNIMAYGFRAVKGIKPIKLPDSVGVMDLKLGVESNRDILSDEDIFEEKQVRDTTTFSIIFSPSGKLVVHEVQVRNKDGQRDTISNLPNTSNDKIFNKKDKVDAGEAMFYQDDYYGVLNNPYGDLGLGPEYSRREFIIYDSREFKQAYEKGEAYTEYLSRLVPIYINAYTGAMISTD